MSSTTSPTVHSDLPKTRAGMRTAARRPGRLAVLDGLRPLAALAVALYHYCAFDRGPNHGAWETAPSGIFGDFSRVSAYGWLGVELFFLISGFVICLSCWGRTTRDFLTGRFARLYPAYWFSVLVTAIVMVLWPVVRVPLPWSEVMVNMTMLQAPLGVDDLDGVYWSLWAELRFYLIFAVLVAIGLTYRRVVTFCVAWGLLGVLAPLVANKWLTMLAMPSFAPFFISGIAMFLLHRFGHRPSAWLLLVGSVVLAMRQLPHMAVTAEESVGHSLSPVVIAAVVLLTYGLMLAVALGGFDRVRWGWLSVAGALTYPLYLLHQNIGWTVIRLANDTMPPWVLLGLLVAGLLVASWLVHRFVERPLARLIRRLAGSSPRRDPDDVAVRARAKAHAQV